MRQVVVVVVVPAEGSRLASTWTAVKMAKRRAELGSFFSRRQSVLDQLHGKPCLAAAPSPCRAGLRQHPWMAGQESELVRTKCLLCNTSVG